MSFQTNFLNNLPSAYRQTKMADILSYIGSAMEVEIIQEAKAMVEKNVDISRMGVEELRKYLSYSYQTIRNYSRAKGSMHIFGISSTTPVTVLSGASVETQSGKRYYITNDVLLLNGGTVDVSIEQGTRNSITGTYSAWISEKVANIDLDSIVLKMNGQIIPPIQNNQPYDGFFVCYFDGVLYIKVFSGIVVNSLLTSIDGSSYVVSYVSCDGQQGNIAVNTVKGFTDTIYDGNGKAVTYSVSNGATTNGVDAPPLYEIRQLWTYWFFTKEVVTKISDYKNWFLSRDVVGDGAVVGDMEIWSELGGIKQVTGKIYACLVSKTLENLSPSDILVLDNALMLVKDVGLVYYFPFRKSKMYFEVKYISSNDNISFQSWIQSAVINMFNLDFVRNAGGSLFDAFDMGGSLDDQDIAAWDVQGLNIIPYYYYSNYEVGSLEFLGFTGGQTNQSFIEAYRFGSVKQGYAFYTFHQWNNYTSKTETGSTNFIEIKDSDVSHPNRYGIYENVAGSYVRIGWNNYDTGVIQFDNKTWGIGYLEMKFEVENRSYIKPKAVVQSGDDLVFYIRYFHNIIVNKIES
jgi:hypothetical protein